MYPPQVNLGSIVAQKVTKKWPLSTWNGSDFVLVLFFHHLLSWIKRRKSDWASLISLSGSSLSEWINWVPGIHAAQNDNDWRSRFVRQHWLDNFRRRNTTLGCARNNFSVISTSIFQWFLFRVSQKKKFLKAKKNFNMVFSDHSNDSVALKFVWITINWKILKEMGIPDYLTCLLRNLYAGQEATVRTGHGTTD